MTNRALLRLAIGALTVVPAVGAFAGTAAATDVPPPPGNAEGYALLIDPLLSVGHTKASTAGSGSATGNAVEVGGKPLIDGTTGGTQSGAGSKHGALLDTGATPLGQLQVTPWEATVTNTASGSSSDSDAALLKLFLVDPTVLRAAVLHSHSHADSNSNGTSGSSSSDGAEVNAGDGQLDVKVLHAESSSSSGGKSYLLSINGNEVGSSDQANGSCALSVPGVASLSCLSASGGKSATVNQASSSVGDATLGSGQGHGTVSGTASSGHPATLGSGSTTTTGNTGNNASSGGSNLPFTGADLPPIVGIGALLLAAGAWMQQAARRFRHGTVRVS